MVFYETQHSIAVVNIKPIVKGRKLYFKVLNLCLILSIKDSMVIPKILRQRVIDMTEDETVDLFLTARMIGDKLEKHLNCTSINFSIQDGPEADESFKVILLF